MGIFLKSAFYLKLIILSWVCNIDGEDIDKIQLI